MIDIMISVLVFILLILCAVYIIKEIIRRKKQKHDDNFVETNWHIGGAIGAWGVGTVATIGFTLTYYLNVFNNPSVLGYFLLCLVGLCFFIIAFFFAYNKIIINKETGAMIACGVIRTKKFNVKDITLIKHTFEYWKVYSNNKKLFTVGNRYHNSPNEFYVYIRKESGCKEKHSKNYVGQDMD